MVVLLKAIFKEKNQKWRCDIFIAAYNSKEFVTLLKLDSNKKKFGIIIILSRKTPVNCEF